MVLLAVVWFAASEGGGAKQTRSFEGEERSSKGFPWDKLEKERKKDK